MWMVPSPDEIDCEVLVGGNSSAPDPVRLAVIYDAMKSLEDLRGKAISYFELFVDRKKFSCDESEWYLVGLESGRAEETNEQFILYFSLGADVYGEWSVSFQVSSGRYIPVAFARRQV